MKQIAGGKEAALCQRELSLGLRDDLEPWNEGREKGSKREEIYEHI